MTPEEQKAVVEKIQAHTLENVLYIPLGEYNPPQARRSNIVDMLGSPVPVFWNVKKTKSNPPAAIAVDAVAPSSMRNRVCTGSASSGTRIWLSIC